MRRDRPPPGPGISELSQPTQMVRVVGAVLLGEYWKSIHTAQEGKSASGRSRGVLHPVRRPAALAQGSALHGREGVLHEASVQPLSAHTWQLVSVTDEQEHKASEWLPAVEQLLQPLVQVCNLRHVEERPLVEDEYRQA